MFPSPVVSCFCVIDWIRPAVSDVLSRIWFICNLQLWLSLSDFISKFLDTETDGSQIVCHPVFDFILRSVHDVNRALDSIIDVHHGKPRLLFNKARVFSFQDAVVEDGHCVICGTSSWFCLPADNSRVSDTSDIQTVFLVIVGSKHLACVFCDAVHCGGLYWAVLGCAFFWCRGTKHGHRTSAEYFTYLELNCNVENVLVGNQVDVPAKLWVFLTRCWQNGCHVVDLSYFVGYADFPESLLVSDISFLQQPIEILGDVSVT